MVVSSLRQTWSNIKEFADENPFSCSRKIVGLDGSSVSRLYGSAT